MIEGLNMTKNEVFENNYLDTLNWLSYWKEKDKVRENLNKRQ